MQTTRKRHWHADHDLILVACRDVADSPAGLLEQGLGRAVLTVQNLRVDLQDVELQEELQARVRQTENKKKKETKMRNTKQVVGASQTAGRDGERIHGKRRRNKGQEKHTHVDCHVIP